MSNKSKEPTCLFCFGDMNTQFPDYSDDWNIYLNEGGFLAVDFDGVRIVDTISIFNDGQPFHPKEAYKQVGDIARDRLEALVLKLRGSHSDAYADDLRDALFDADAGIADCLTGQLYRTLIRSNFISNYNDPAI